MILSVDPDITFIESDLAVMLHQKQQLVRQVIGNRANQHFVEIDATDNLILNEKQRGFANVSSLLQIYGEAWITPDLTTKAIGQMRQQDPVIRQVFEKIARSTDRTFAENELDDLDHVYRFAQEQGFQVESFSMVEVIDQLKCLFTLEINRNLVKLILSATPVFALMLTLSK